MWTETLRAGGGHVLSELSPAHLADRLDRLAAMTPIERLQARLCAGDAYRRWRADGDAGNILDLARAHQ